MNEAAIKKFFEEKLHRSGHSLEIMVTKILNQYSVQQEVPYIDKDESKGRFSDVVATRQIPPVDLFQNKSVDGKRAVGQFILIVECKNLPDHGWILWESKPSDLIFMDSTTLADNVKPELFNGNPAYKYIPWSVIPELFSASGYEEYVYDSGKQQRQSKSNPRTTNIVDSLMKVTKATEYHVQVMRDVLSKDMVTASSELKNFFLFSYVQPCIVFKGHLYGARDKGQIQLEKIKYAQLPKRYVSEHYNVSRGMIHVVSFDSFPEYLNLIESRYLSLSNRMVNDQEVLMDKIFVMVDYLNKRVNFHLGPCSGRFQKLLEFIHGKALESKLSEIRAPSIYFVGKISSDHSQIGETSNTYAREINYCFNCGTAVTTMMKPEEIVCCPVFKNCISSNFVEVKVDNSGLGMHRFYTNVINHRDYLQFLNKNIEGNVEEITIKWCPYCGVKIPDETGNVAD